MPVHERLYRRLEVRPPERTVFGALPLAAYGYRYARGKMFWIIRVLSFIPAIGIGFLCYQLGSNPALQRNLPMFGGPTEALTPEAWRTNLGPYIVVFLGQQIWFANFMAAVVGAGAVAEDLRCHALELYFSKPINGLGYATGRFLQVWRAVAIVEAAPVLVVIAAAFSFLKGCSENCKGFAVEMVLAALAISAVQSILVLGCSALFRRTRNAVLGWFGISIITGLMSAIFRGTTDDPRFELLSLGQNLAHLGADIIGVAVSADPAETADWSAGASYAVLGGWILLAIFLIHRRFREVGRA